MTKRYDLRSQGGSREELDTTITDVEEVPVSQRQFSEVLSCIQELAKSLEDSRKEMTILRNQVSANQPQQASDISTENGNIREMPQNSTRPQESPVVFFDSTHKLYDLPQFSGVAEDWPLFITNFTETTNMYKYSNRQNLMRLQKCLQGQAREAVISMLIYPESVPQAIEELEFRYGRPDILVRSQLAKIQQFPVINHKKLSQFIDFSTKVRNVVTFLNSANCTHHLMNATLLEELVNKLPADKQFDWARFAMQIKPYPTITDFSDWLSDTARIISLMPNTSTQTVQSKQVMVIDRTKKVQCVICEKNHNITKCKEFENMPLSKRWEKVKQLKLCFSCLYKGHGTALCRNKKSCGIDDCKRNHHKILHDSNKSSSEVLLQNQEDSSPLQPILNCRTQQASILFKIFPVTIYGPAGSFKVFAMFDEGSSISLIAEETAKQLGVKGKPSDLTLQWYGDKVVTEKSFKVQFEIKGMQKYASRYTLKNVHTVPNLNLPNQSFNKSDYNELHSLPVESYYNAYPVILLGLDNSHLGITSHVIEYEDVNLITAQTKLGWLVYGSTNFDNSSTSTVMHIKDNEMQNIVEEFIENENFGTNPNGELLLSDENENAKDILKNTTKKICNRFETGLLWKKYPPFLPPSFEMAKRRLLTVEKKMTQDPLYSTRYIKEMDKYLEKGYARKLTADEVNDQSLSIWYLPHFGVVSPHKPDKLRVVFDAAAKVGDVSLNTALAKSPEQAKPLLGILMKFRQGPIGVAADIREMFSQIKIRPEDQHSQRFLWRNGDTKKSVQHYAMVSMTFGAICSPCCAEYIKNLNASHFSKQFPEASSTIIDKHYVDDFVCSFNSEDEAVKVCKDVVYIHSQGGFELRGFTSNSKRVESVMNNNASDDVTQVKMEKQTSTDKILGMYWKKDEDMFVFHTKFHCLSHEVLDESRVPTKRELLKITMSIFDPFGMIADFLLYPKTLVQKTWKTNINWDDLIPQELHKHWKSWWNEFKQVKYFKIARCLSLNLLQSENVQLHIFVDASQEAFAAVCYLRISFEDDIDLSFVIGKVRCAPKKLLSIPRLELQASVLGVRLSKSVMQNHEFKISSCHFWTDSQTVLRWIYSKERRFKAYVSHRIAEILRNTEPVQWNWVPTQLNTADAGTRTVYPPKFNPESKWIMGPSFLKKDKIYWPKSIIDIPNHSLEEELKPSLIINGKIKAIFDYNRFSSYLKLKRTAAWVKRLTSRECYRNNQLSVTELDAAEKLICRLVQEESFPKEVECMKNEQKLSKRSSIYSLIPTMYSDGLLRLNSRLTEATCLPFDARKPIILPQKHRVSELIVKMYHEKNYHQNVSLTLNEIRQKFWIPHIKSIIKKVIRNCFVCKNESVQPQQPRMGELPLDRFTPYVRPFSYTGVDLFEPFNVAVGRRREKRWAIIFTCLTTRAAHIEVAENLSTDAFILCLRNFINRRGTPVRIRSDNGTNFLGTQNVLKSEDQILNIDKINNEASKRNIEWIFNCPINPSSGGCWERLIRIVKRLLKKTLKDVAPRVETLRSVLIEAENIINSRPLTEIPISSADEEPLTPNHFLLGCLNSTQTSNFTNDEICFRKQWRIAQNLKDRLWKRWIKEYLPQLLCRSKWLEEAEPLKADDVVLIFDCTIPRHKWLKGIVLKTYPAKDGQVRFVDLKTANGVLRRPASKLALLKVNPIDSRGGEM